MADNTPDTVETLDPLAEDAWPAYVEACAAKQLGLDAKAAAEHVAKLKPAQIKAIRAAGRDGQAARARELLEGAPLTEAEGGKPPKGKGKHGNAE